MLIFYIYICKPAVHDIYRLRDEIVCAENIQFRFRFSDPVQKLLLKAKFGFGLKELGYAAY